MRPWHRGLAVTALVWMTGVTAARAWRPPNDFAEAHWLLDYRFGFVRRGLMGSVLRELSWLGASLQTESAIRTLAYSVCALLFAVFVAVSVRVAVRTSWNRHIVLLASVALTSPFIVTHAHLMGYLDHLVFLVAAASLALVMAGYPWWGATLAAAGVFVHESTLLFTAPLLAFALARPGQAPPRPATLRAWLPLALPIAAFATVAALDAFGANRLALRQLLQLRLHRYAFIGGDMHLFVPEWITTTFVENLTAQRHRFLERLTDGSIVITIVPAAQALVFAALGWVAPAHRRCLAWWLAAVACAPLLLHLTAWDTARIWTYTTAALFFGLWIVVERWPGAPSPALGLAPALAIPALLAHVAARIPLLDQATERFSGTMLLALYAPAVLLWLAYVAVDRRTQGVADA